MSDIDYFVSVVIPTRNRKDILKQCLESFENQSYPQDCYEIIVVDDGSTDGTKELLEEASKRMTNLRHFSQPKGGPAKARNLGIRNAKGPVILFTGDDCIANKHLLREHLRLHKKREAIAVLGHIDWHPDLKVTPFMRFITIDTQFSYPKIKEMEQDVPFIYFYTSNISMAKKHIEQAGNFDEEFKEAIFEDVELGYRIWKSGVTTVYNPRAIVYHDHKVELKDYIKRQDRLGRAASLLYNKHPELLALLRVPMVSSPEVRYRFYHAVLEYSFFAGLQGGLEASDNINGLVALEKRLKNWSDIEKDRLMKTVITLEDRMAREIRGRDKEIQKRDREIQQWVRQIHKQHEEIQKRDREIVRRDELIETLTQKNQEKHYRIVALEKFECRVKSSFVYQIYRFLRKPFKR